MSKRNVNTSLIANYEVSKKALGKFESRSYKFKDDQAFVIKKNRAPSRPIVNVDLISGNKVEKESKDFKTESPNQMDMKEYL